MEALKKGTPKIRTLRGGPPMETQKIGTPKVGTPKGTLKRGNIMGDLGHLIMVTVISNNCVASDPMWYEELGH